MDDLFRIKLHFSYSFSTGPKRKGGDMENLNFENFFGSSVAIHKKEQSVVLTASSQKAKAMGKPIAMSLGPFIYYVITFLGFLNPIKSKAMT